jgi:hypothetical protein
LRIEMLVVAVISTVPARSILKSCLTSFASRCVCISTRVAPKCETAAFASEVLVQTTSGFSDGTALGEQLIPLSAMAAPRTNVSELGLRTEGFGRLAS